MSTSSQTIPESEPLLPPRNSYRRSRSRTVVIAMVWIMFSPALLFGIFTMIDLLSRLSSRKISPFYSRVSMPQGICVGQDGKGVSHVGYIGLDGDNEYNPKRSFFWYFEAKEDPENAPVILTIGGGPGSSGMLNPLRAQSHCIVTTNGTTIPNPHAWTERFNLLALDHPVGSGFSYGTLVNNSRSAAIDVYDFLQKFLSLYPHLTKNELIVAGGSYGGVYGPHIATVIQEGNRAVRLGNGQPGAVHINLVSLMISNPLSDHLSRSRWFLHQACYNTKLYNSTTCSELFAILPQCLEDTQFAYENHSIKNRLAAMDSCRLLYNGDAHGTMPENVSKKCDGSVEDCFPEMAWVSKFMNSPLTKKKLGVPANLTFISLSDKVWAEFQTTGDEVQQAYLMYEPLLNDGIRLLHYIGAKDTNCGWPGILSFLKLLRTRYQAGFRSAPDVPWPSTAETTVRVVGEGAGDMTYVLIADAGHFAVQDQPGLVKDIIEHWIDNRPFM